MLPDDPCHKDRQELTPEHVEDASITELIEIAVRHEINFGDLEQYRKILSARIIKALNLK